MNRNELNKRDNGPIIGKGNGPEPNEKKKNE